MEEKRKRQRKEILVPSEHKDCPLEIIVLLVIEMLSRLLAHNDSLDLKPSQITRFHSRSKSPITIHDYLQRITKYVIVEKSVLIMVVVYIDRMCLIYPEFVLSSLTIHRFLIAAITVCCKLTSDVYSTNSFFAKVGGIGMGELNLLELELCKVLDWKLNCSNQAIQMYYMNLVSSNRDYRMDSDRRGSVANINTFLD
jgi:hypothetical protein